MRVYLAGLHGDVKRVDKIKPLYILDSFIYSNDKLIKYKNSDYCKSYMLDSGAFTFMRDKENVTNWEKYVERYAKFINKHDVDLFFELDIDSVVGLKEVEKLRTKLEKLTNKKCIPVWHKSRGKEYWLQMVKDYNYVAIGGIAIKTIKPKDYKYFIWFLNEAKKENCKVHGLGFTSTRLLKKFRFDSVDSTTWLRTRFGDISYFKNDRIKFYKKKNSRIKKNKIYDVSLFSLSEWKKFQQYANKNL